MVVLNILKIILLVMMILLKKLNQELKILKKFLKRILVNVILKKIYYCIDHILVFHIVNVINMLMINVIMKLL